MTDRLSSTSLRFLGTRDSLTALEAIDTTILKNGSCVYVTAMRALFALLKESSDPADGVNIVAPLAGTGRWLRWEVGSNAWVTQAEWYVDEQNVTGNASDSNTGDIATAPLATMTEWSRRVGGTDVVLPQTTTVHLLSDVENDRRWWFFGQTLLPAYLRIVGEATTQLLGPTVLTGVQNIVINASRPSIQVAGINWNTAGPGGSSLVNKRCRVTVSAGAQLDALFWILAVDSGDPSIAYITRPLEASPPAFGVSRALAIGDTIVVEELTRAGEPNIRQTTVEKDFSYSTTNVSIEHVRGTEVPLTSSAVLGTLDQLSGVSCYGCDLSWGVVVCAFATFQACLWGNTSNVNVMVTHSGAAWVGMGLAGGGGVRLNGPGTVSVFNSLIGQTQIAFSLEGGPILLNVNSDLSLWDWAGSGIFVESGCLVRATGRIWGTSATGARGISIRTGGAVYYQSQPTITAGGIDFTVGGVNGTYAGLPASGQDPGNNNAWLVAYA